MMWQEARKQEKKIRGLLVDYKRRAERRKDYYEKIKADPTQFIQLHGRPCKIHLDPAVAIAGDSPANMMSWQGNHDILIDRFDVRAHLDFIPENTSKKDEDEDVSQEERYINYERYRILAQNDFLGVSEDKFLQQLALEEQFGPVEKSEPLPIEGKKKVPGAAIGYNYNEGTSTSAVGAVSGGGGGGGVGAGESAAVADNDSNDEDNDEEDDEDSDIDFDLCVDVNKISSAQAHEMNAAALAYGMCSNDFFSYLTRDVEEAETMKLAREREEEKAMFSGRKSRRERRAFREKKLVGRKLSPPSYAASKAAPIADLIRNVAKSKSRSRSRSLSPPNAGMIQYITSFGGDEVPLEPPPPQIIKTSVHTSKDDDKTYKRTVRYRSSRSPDSSKRRVTERAYGSRRRSRSQSPSWRSKSPVIRMVRYNSRSRSPARSVEASREQSHKNTNYRKRSSGSKSRSPTPVQRIVKKSDSPQPVRSVEVPAPPVITRYYGRRKNESSSSELDLSDSDDKNDLNSEKTSPDKNVQAVGNAGGRSKPGASLSASSKISLQERLKKKRQALINRQYKADKKAERLRLEKAEQERQDREDEMREISIKMRRRERQKRHQYYELDDSNAADMSDDDRSSSASSASGSDKHGSGSEHRSRSSKKSNKGQDSDKGRNSQERDRSRERGKESHREKVRSPERDRDRDRWSRRRDRDEERPWRDRSRDRSKDTRDRDTRDRDTRDREIRGRDTRDREIRDRDARDREARDRSRDRYRRDRDREGNRDRDRHFMERRRSRERDHSDGDSVVVKAKRPLVDY